MRISVWSSDVCSSDLTFEAGILRAATDQTIRDRGTPHDAAARFYASYAVEAARNGSDLSEIKFGNVLGRLLTLKQEMLFFDEHKADRKSVVSGKSVSVRLDLGGRRIIQQKFFIFFFS